MYGYIYETTCIPTGKKYIGMHKWSGDTIDPDYFGSGIYLVKALDKYGKENFSCKVIEWCKTREELLEKEAYYVSKFKAPISEEYYNIADGGCGGHSEYYIQPVTQKQLDSLEYGRHLPASDTLKKKLSQIRTGVEVSDITREKLRSNQLGRKYINNGEINKCIPEVELDNYLNNGWKLGQVPKDRTERINKFKTAHCTSDNTEWKLNISKAIKGRKWVTNGVIDKQVKPEEIDFYLSKGFYLGRCKARG